MPVTTLPCQCSRCVAFRAAQPALATPLQEYERVYSQAASIRPGEPIRPGTMVYPFAPSPGGPVVESLALTPTTLSDPGPSVVLDAGGTCEECEQTTEN